MEYFSFFYFVKILRNSRKKSLRWKFFLCLNGWGSLKKPAGVSAVTRSSADALSKEQR